MLEISKTEKNKHLAADMINLAAGAWGVAEVVAGRSWLQKLIGAGVVWAAVDLWKFRHPQKAEEINLTEIQRRQG